MHNTLEFPESLFEVITFRTGGMNAWAFIVLSILLQSAIFFEDIRSKGQLMEIAADRFSIRQYLGYDPHEPLPDNSSLTRIRERYGLQIFRGFLLPLGSVFGTIQHSKLIAWIFSIIRIAEEPLSRFFTRGEHEGHDRIANSVGASGKGGSAGLSTKDRSSRFIEDGEHT